MAASPMPQPGQDPSQGAGGAPPDPSQGAPGGGQPQQDVPMIYRQCAALSTLANQIAQANPAVAPDCQDIIRKTQDMIRKIVLSSAPQQQSAPPY